MMKALNVLAIYTVLLSTSIPTPTSGYQTCLTLALKDVNLSILNVLSAVRMISSASVVVFATKRSASMVS